MVLTAAHAPSSVLAFVTTVHASLLILRLHRGATPSKYLLALPAFAFCILPWTLAAPGWLALVLTTHLVWFVACERLAPVPAAAAPRAVSPRAISAARPGLSHTPAPTRTSNAFVPLEVLSIQPESESIRTFRLERPQGFEFQAGQFLPVRVEIDGHPHVRCYSISSCPQATGYLEISVRRQGLVSGWLHDHLRTGAHVSARPPGGHFVYPADNQKPLVLIAGGIGITPVLSMLRHAVAAESRRPVLLLYSVRSHTDLAFEDELLLLARRHPQVGLVFTVTGDCVIDRYRHGRIDAALLREVVPDLTGSVYLMCGPTAMLDGLRAALAQAGVPAADIRSEAFEAAAAFGATTPPGAGVAAGTVRTLQHCRLRLEASALETEVTNGETLLEAAERAGADIPSLCRAGACGTCRTRLLAGRVEGPVETDGGADGPEQYVLPCVARPVADCTIEA